MGWASRHIEKLMKGETVQFRPRGNSMTGKVNDGQLVTVEPRPDGMLPLEGAIVLCKVRGAEYLHLVLRVDTVNEQIEIGNNKGHVNGWTSLRNIYGSVIKVED